MRHVPDIVSHAVCFSLYTNKILNANRFLFSGQLSYHRLKHGRSADSIVKCCVCNHSCPDQRCLLKHQRASHVPSILLKCTKCEKMFTVKKALRLHMNRHAMEATLECDICQKKFRYKKNLLGHMHFIHVLNRVPRGTRDSRRVITYHKHRCKLCSTGISFQSLLMMNAHYKDVHATDERLKNVCPYCNDLLVSDHDLSTHFSSDLTPYKCDICLTPMKCKTAMALHQRRHENSVMCQVITFLFF